MIGFIPFKHNPS